MFDNTLVRNQTKGDFSGNRVVGNNIGTNNLGGAGSVAGGDDNDPYTSGVYVGSVDAMSITVSGNVIHNNHYGIFSAGPVQVNGAFSNFFYAVILRHTAEPTYAG